MNSEALRMFLTLASSDDAGLIDLLLQSHAAQLRRARESMGTERGSLAWWVRWRLFGEGERLSFSLSRFWGEVS
ncbi:MAG TPA: hypothetical protein VE820_06090 [Sphingomicrobium sp.]|nr:hypothetical protein [Sphingomicrobium sp.]